MKTIVYLIIFIFSSIGFSQGNLQFNRVITFTPGSNYTVPTGKVLKIESVNMNGVSVSVPKTSTQSITCYAQYVGNYQLTVGVYAPVTALSIGGINFSTSNITGTCDWLSNPTPANTITTLTTPVFQTPIWLEAGKVVSVYSGVASILISAIEFNIIP